MTGRWIPDDWTFASEDVATRFDTHVRETLPWYDLATPGTAHLVRAYLPNNGVLYDIGASTGNIGRAIAPTLEARNATMYAIEPTREMADLYDAPGTLLTEDATAVDYKPFDVAVLFLVLMFIRPDARTELLDTLRRNLRPGGAIIIVDKTEAFTGYLGSTLTRWTLSQKQLGGINPDEIVEKELSLVGSQRPVRPGYFDDYNCWLRIGEFAGYIFTNDDHA